MIMLDDADDDGDDDVCALWDSALFMYASIEPNFLGASIYIYIL